jgi:hypothetical protein
MKLLITMIGFGFLAGAQSQAQQVRSPQVYVKVRDVTHEYYPIHGALFPTPTPSAPPQTGGIKTGAIPGGTVPPSTGANPPPITDPLPPLPGAGIPGGTTPPGGYTAPPSGPVSLGDLITIGQKVWDFIVTNKPNATYQSFKSSVVPSGITSWTQLRGWSKPTAKVYRVEFTNIFGRPAGSFDYRITFVSGGNYRGKGKYIGQISFVPANIRLGTDRSLDVKAELLDPLNFGTEEDPIAGAELQITWSSPTTTRYQMNSVELFLYGTGEIQNLSDGN